MRTGPAARRGLRAAATIALGASGFLAFGFVAFGAAARAATSACTRTSGVTVIVEYTRGTVVRGCAPGHPANGLAALKAAGFSYDGTAQYGDAFVCRIDGNPSDQACASTPPPNAYWAYYHARATDTAWTYWSVGAAQSTPAPGSIDAWAFGADVRPSVSPGAVAPPAAPPTTRPAPTIPVTAAASVPVAAPAPAPASTAAAPVRSHTAPTPTVTSASVTTVPTVTTAPARATTTPSTTTPPGAVRIVDHTAAPPAPTRSRSNSPLPVLVAIVALASAGTASFFVVRARRRPRQAGAS